jgi:hypothetical protein
MTIIAAITMREMLTASEALVTRAHIGTMIVAAIEERETIFQIPNEAPKVISATSDDDG